MDGRRATAFDVCAFTGESRLAGTQSSAELRTVAENARHVIPVEDDRLPLKVLLRWRRWPNNRCAGLPHGLQTLWVCHETASPL